MLASPTSVRFTRTGRAYHLDIATAADLRNALDLDEALWVATSAPIDTLHLDALFLQLVDTDHDGRIKPPELKDAIRWCLEVLCDARGLDAEVWVHPSDWRSLDDAVRADPRMADFRAFREDRIYNNDRRMNDQGGNDYWESGSLRPDRVLADFIWILHPDLLPDHEPVFHRRLPQHRNVG